ncbi:MAG TPA: nuclear transport factor 2 family protein [Polyangiaceae bacterium]|jgi:ketosteroid isomerase-like protein|nr:nuclear transport factor 2 family protein [Polyangiaceae bacterium]
MGASSPDHEQKRVAEVLIRERVQRWASAISAKDIDRVMSLYSPDIVSFDLDPPLRYSGASHKRHAWEQFFSAFQQVSYEVDEPSITAGADTAFVHSLNHVKGRLPNGQVNDLWVRWTACFQRANADWLIVHDHASVPADVAHGRAVLDLQP